MQPIPFSLPAALDKADIWVADFAHGHVILRPNRTFVGGGLSDRFALGGRAAMLNVYMKQFELQLGGSAWMVDSEHLLCQHLVRHGVVVGFEPRICVVRMRADGTVPPADILEARSTHEACEGAECCRPRTAGVRMDGAPRHSCSFPDTLGCPWPNATCGYDRAFTKATITRWRKAKAAGRKV